jgi:hypothetical protein
VDDAWPLRGLTSGHRSDAVRMPVGCRVTARVRECLADGTITNNQTIETTMSSPIDYTRLAATLDYVALEKKLEQLKQRDPPRRRKTVADVLEPLRERLLALRRKGWKTGELAEELKAAGVPVSPARLRECLNRWTTGGDAATKSRARRRQKYAPSNTQATITAGHSGRGNESQTGQRVTTR